MEARSLKSKIPKGKPEALNLRYQRGNQKKRKSKIPNGEIRRCRSKIPKGKSEDVNRKRTNNTMAKRY
jgi:hypothetical protein